jgi:hypothetical protein
LITLLENWKKVTETPIYENMSSLFSNENCDGKFPSVLMTCKIIGGNFIENFKLN